VTPAAAGSNTYIQFNKSGAIAGNAAVRFDDSINSLILTGGAVSPGSYLLDIQPEVKHGVNIALNGNSAYNAFQVGTAFVINGAGVISLGALTAALTLKSSALTIPIGSTNNIIETLNGTAFGGHYGSAFTFRGNFGSSGKLTIGQSLGMQGIWYKNTQPFGIYKGEFETTTSPILFVTTSDQIGINTASVDASAVLQVNSTSRGFLPPRMTTTQKGMIASPVEGLIIYDNVLHKLCVYTGSAWETITSS
jgi:hypothetical protein